MDTDRIKGAAQDLGGKVQETAGRALGEMPPQAEGVVRQVAGNAQNLYGQAKDNISSAASNAQDLYGQAKDNLGNVAGNAQNLYGQARDNVSNAAGTVTDYANQAYRQASPHAERGTQLVRDRVGENPLTAVLLAGAIGYLLALAIHGRH